MSIAGAVTAAIRQCGRETALEQDGAVFRFFACVQPRAYDTQARTQNIQSRFGKIDPRQFIYYGPLSGGGERVPGRVPSSRWGANAMRSCSATIFTAAAIRRFAGRRRGW